MKYCEEKLPNNLGKFQLITCNLIWIDYRLRNIAVVIRFLAIIRIRNCNSSLSMGFRFKIDFLESLETTKDKKKFIRSRYSVCVYVNVCSRTFPTSHKDTLAYIKKK